MRGINSPHCLLESQLLMLSTTRALVQVKFQLKETGAALSTFESANGLPLQSATCQECADCLMWHGLRDSPTRIIYILAFHEDRGLRIDANDELTIPLQMQGTQIGFATRFPSQDESMRQDSPHGFLLKMNVRAVSVLTRQEQYPRDPK
eukprot:scaffold4156_cov64-Cylindrotheca_fusiformis.AAC.1